MLARVLAPDLVGYGKSDNSNIPFNYPDCEVKCESLKIHDSEIKEFELTRYN
jgi:hypothetical protein